MCGICGIYSLNGEPVRAEAVAAQIETIVHRGPNEGDLFISAGGRCGLGIRRLSIIDVAGGHQPLSNEDGSVQLVYNGETYNYRRLRRELEQLGHRPRTLSDAEVILHGYEAWGPAGVLQRLRGMAAFALWDDERRQLLVARDRFGIKPLYYAAYQGRLYFASEIKAILSQTEIPRRVNLHALEAMLKLGFVPGPATMFEGIYKLPAAHFLLAHDDTFEIKRYWQLDYRPADPMSITEAAEQFLALLQEAVQIRLMSEVPLGALLSGGLDSGTLVALIEAGLREDRTRLAGRPSPGSTSMEFAPGQSSFVDLVGPKLKTISIGFDRPAYDEAAAARHLARYIGTEHHTITFTARDFDDYPAVMAHLEEPQCSATAMPIYKLYQACREAGLTVVLTGEGSDELLGGYFWHKGDALMRPLLAFPALLRRLIAASPLPMSAAARRVLARGTKDTAARYQDWLEIEGHAYRQTLLSAEVAGELGQNGPNPLLVHWADALLEVQSAAPLNQTLWLEAQTRMVDFINFEVDKMSMAHSIEARVPFLDHKLWEFCAGLPASYKLNGRVEKYLLRRATRQLLPEVTRSRPKKGLAAPYSHWLQAQRLPAWAEATLSSAAIQNNGLFNPTSVQNLRRAHQNGQPNLGPILMGVLSTQVWFDAFMK